MHTDLIKVKNDYENSWGNLNVEAAMPSYSLLAVIRPKIDIKYTFFICVCPIFSVKLRGQSVHLQNSRSDLTEFHSI